ncbi:unnamed protein product [Aspergillus oryzae]|nr:unnamed protein product [Aspergillus oryzae]
MASRALPECHQATRQQQRSPGTDTCDGMVSMTSSTYIILFSTPPLCSQPIPRQVLNYSSRLSIDLKTSRASSYSMPQSFATFRNRRSDELARLADEHLQQDLRQEDRDTLKSAASKVSFWTGIGSAVGIGMGLYVAFRLRSSRKAFFDVFRAQERPTQVVFADGRTGFLGGAASGSRTITADPEQKKRIETAFRRFRADVLRKEADALDRGVSVEDKMF